jgi:uncharacterized Zn finger protein
MDRPTLNEADLFRYVSPEIVQRGREYERRGAVLSLELRGTVLSGEVEGSEFMPYLTQCTLSEDGIAAASCTCPYGAWCKHCIALCLAYIHETVPLRIAPTLGEMLADLDASQLRALLEHLTSKDARLVEAIESSIPLVPASSPSREAQKADGIKKPVPPPPHADAIRRQVRGATRSLGRMRSSEAYWHVGAVANEIDRMLQDSIWPQIEAGNGRIALQALEAVTEEYLAEWEVLDDSDGDASQVFYALGEAFTEAVLCEDLPKREREYWLTRMDQWQDAIDDYGVDDAFAPARAAARQGWTSSRLKAVLAGKASSLRSTTAAEADDEEIARSLNLARVHILERQGRYEEMLNLARAAGLRTEYGQGLVQLGRIAEAIQYAQTEMRTAGEAQALALVLLERGERAAALHVAERGLILPNREDFWQALPWQAETLPPFSRASLAKWLRDVAGTDDRNLAARAAEVAALEEVTLANYLRAHDLAGDVWVAMRERLLQQAREKAQMFGAEGAVDIFLHEGLIKDAMAVADRGYLHQAMLERVVDAALPIHPEWVIRTCQPKAERIMDEKRSSQYDEAALWLKKARQAYFGLNRREEWDVYLAGQMQTHARQHKLMPLLKELR